MCLGWFFILCANCNEFRLIFFILCANWDFWFFIWCIYLVRICSIFGVLVAFSSIKIWRLNCDIIVLLWHYFFLLLYYEKSSSFYSWLIKISSYQFSLHYNYDLWKSNFSSIKMLMCLNLISHINFEINEKQLSLTLKL